MDEPPSFKSKHQHPEERALKILIIMPRPPYPLRSGGDHAQFHLISEISKSLDISVCFEVLPHQQKDYEQLKYIWNKVDFLPLIIPEARKTFRTSFRHFKKQYKSLWKAASGMFSSNKDLAGDPIRYQSFIHHPLFPQNEPLYKHVASILSNRTFDVIQIDFISLAPLVYLLPAESKKLLVHHEIRYVRIRREMDLFKTLSAFDRARFESIRHQELSLLERFDKIITLTETDRNLLLPYFGPGKISALKVSIPVEQGPDVPFRPFSNTLVFLGSSDHLPNIEGLSWFVECVLPILEKTIPSIKLEVFGKWHNRYITQFKRKNVVFKGFVASLREEFPGKAMVVPIRIGSGLRLKIIEAVRHNIPFISTSIGLEGLDFRDTLECLVADDPQNFARAVHKLSESPSMQKSLVENAGKLLNQNLSIENLAIERTRFYLSLL